VHGTLLTSYTVAKVYCASLLHETAELVDNSINSEQAQTATEMLHLRSYNCQQHKIGSYGIVAKYQLQCSSRLFLYSFFPDWITATVSCLDSLIIIQRLQSVQNAAARLIFRTLRSEHITQRSSVFTSCASQRISFKLAVMTYRSIHGIPPSYLQSCFTRVSDMASRRRLRSSTSHRIDVPPVRLSTVGRQAFPVSGATVWNDLPLHVVSAPSLAVFRQRLKTFLFPVLTKTLSYDSCVTIIIHHYLDTCGPFNI